MKNWKWYEQPIAAFWFLVGCAWGLWLSIFPHSPYPTASDSRPEGQRVDGRTGDGRSEEGVK